MLNGDRSPSSLRNRAAWVLVGRVGGGDPNSGLNANLESITAVVIGGTSLFGGRVVLVGSLIGALIVQVFWTSPERHPADPLDQGDGARLA